MKSLYLLPLSIALILLSFGLVACKEKQAPTLAKEAQELYSKSVGLISLYTDSLLASKDSSTLIQLDKRFENTLTKLNYQYPAGTDYEITEGENDTLTMMSVRYVSLKDSLLKAFAGNNLSPDSIPADSIAVYDTQEPASRN